MFLRRGTVYGLVISWLLLVFGIAWLAKVANDLDTLTRNLHGEVGLRCRQVEHVKAIVAADKARQLANSELFLKSHPHGIPGISRALILRGEADTRSTLLLLHPIPCK